MGIKIVNGRLKIDELRQFILVRAGVEDRLSKTLLVWTNTTPGNRFTVFISFTLDGFRQNKTFKTIPEFHLNKREIAARAKPRGAVSIMAQSM